MGRASRTFSCVCPSCLVYRNRSTRCAASSNTQPSEAPLPQGLGRGSASPAGELCWSPAAVPWARPNGRHTRGQMGTNGFQAGTAGKLGRALSMAAEVESTGHGGERDRAQPVRAWLLPPSSGLRPAAQRCPLGRRLCPVCASRSAGRARWQTRRGRLSRGPAPPRSPWKGRRPGRDAEESRS